MSNDDLELLDPVRSLVLQKIREHHLTMKGLSKLAQKNEAYFSQFIWRGSPKYLPFDVQNLLSQILQIPVELLHGGKLPVDHYAPVVPVHGIGHPSHSDEGDLTMLKRREGFIPVYECPGKLDDKAAVDWVSSPGPYVGAGAAFGVWIMRSTSRLRPGDLIFVRPSQPTLEGNIAVVGLGDQLLSVGEVTKMNANAAVIRSNDFDESYDSLQHRIMKVTAVVFR